MSREVLRSLLQDEGAWVSGEDIATRLGLSRTAVWKQVRSLRSEGYEIEASTGRGYRLTESPDLLHEDLIKAGLDARLVGRSIFCHNEISSTNAAAKEIAPSAEEGTVVLAEVQTGGRGRMDRSWHSPRGGVWMSVILKPEIHPTLAFRVNLAASLAVARSISNLYGLVVGIKWPNDLMLRERKICGILTEIGAEMDRLNWAVVGVGINANLDPERFSADWKATSLTPTSLSHELGRKVSRVDLIRQVLVEMESAYEEMLGSFETVHGEWQDRSVTLGKKVRIISRESEFEGLATGLEEDGALRVRRDDGRVVRVLAGDCVHLRPAR